MRRPNRSIPAIPRTVFDDTERSLPRVELVPTMGTRRCAARIANSGCTGTRLELVTTGTTVTNGRMVGESTLLKQFTVGSPKGNLFDLVTGRAKGHKVTQAIGFTVVAEQAERAGMVYRQSRSNNAATLARIAITLTRRLTLPAPVLAPVADMTAKPSRVVLAAPRRGRTPLSKAGTATEVVGLNRTRRFLNRVPTSRTLHLDPVQSCAFSMGTLPRSVTSKTTKRLLRHGHVIRLSLNSNPALNTSNSDHTELYHVWTVANGGHFA